MKPACIHNKCLRITHPGGESMALVDVGVMPAEHIGARAVYAADAVEAVFAAFAEPDAIGLSAIAAACGPISAPRRSGRWVRRARTGPRGDLTWAGAGGGRRRPAA